ncbi:MAG: AI-2E family transporter [Bacteroidetes bacterium]|nr:AI-2E family transporter [Bacteroidota bacterium]
MKTIQAKNNQKNPFYAHFAYVLVSLICLFTILYYGRHILFPLLFAMLMGILLRPVEVFFNLRLKIPRVASIFISVFLAILFLSSIILFISWQIGYIAHDWDKISQNIFTHYHNIQKWIFNKFNISNSQIEHYLKNSSALTFDKGTKYLNTTITTFSEFLLNLTLIPIYTFLIMLYRKLFINFLNKIVANKYKRNLNDILRNIKSAIQSYLLGLLTEMGIVATLTSIGYTIAGIEYALLLGVITGLLNMIPYIGITIAAVLSIFATLTSSTDLSLILSVVAVNAIVQFLDNNILVPMIVSSKVKINAIASIVGIIIGGTIAGVSGMFLAIPIIAIIKVIFDNIDSLEPWGYLIGDETDEKKSGIKIPFINKIRKRSEKVT